MHNHRWGFTLLELLVTLAIIGIMLSIAIPSWKNFQTHLQSKLMTESILESLMYARIEALLTNQAIQIKPINNNYQNGWEILNNTSLLKIYPPSPVLITNIQLSRKNIITFQSNGMSEGSNGSFIINNQYKVTLNRGGRAYISHTPAAARPSPTRGKRG